jgi:hypothetical protein
MPSPATPGVSRERVYAIIAATVLVLGLLRALLVVAHSPMLGYTQSGSPSSQAAGFLSLAIIAAVAIFTAYSLRRNPVASLVHAFLFFLIVADPLAALWLNAATPETAALVALYCGVAMLGVTSLGVGRWAHHALLGLSVLVVVATVGYLTFVRSESRVAAGLTVVPAASGEFAREGFVHHAFRGLARDIPASASIAPPSLDISAGSSMRTIADLPPHIMSFTALLSRVPVAAWMMIVMVMILTVPFAAVAIWHARRKPGISTRGHSGGLHGVGRGDGVHRRGSGARHGRRGAHAFHRVARDAGGGADDPAAHVARIARPDSGTGRVGMPRRHRAHGRQLARMDAHAAHRDRHGGAHHRESRSARSRSRDGRSIRAA